MCVADFLMTITVGRISKSSNATRLDRGKLPATELLAEYQRRTVCVALSSTAQLWWTTKHACNSSNVCAMYMRVWPRYLFSELKIKSELNICNCVYSLSNRLCNLTNIPEFSVSWDLLALSYLTHRAGPMSLSDSQWGKNSRQADTIKIRLIVVT